MGATLELSLSRPKTFKASCGHVVLSNGLQVFLISDPDTDKASAAMDVSVGSLSDPLEFPGLAHFLEHMLFYSSEKYPEEDGYSKFISEHGGSTNAFTAAEDTNYHFDVNHDHLEAALDRFAQFFICPLISEDGVDREANAVDSEHGKNVNTDAWRFSQLWKSNSNPDHPFSRFHTGNLETLITGPKSKGMNAHKAVKQFAEDRYSANIMRLVLYGRETLSELEGLARSKFDPVEDKGLKGSSYSGDAVRGDQLQCLIKVVPQKETDSLCMQWPIPPQQSLHRSQPSGYVSHHLGHEGEGSVFDVLRSKGWATQLSAGESGSSFSGRSFFTVNIVLTREGQKYVKEVTTLVFAYIEMLRQPNGVTHQRFEEMRALQHMRFTFSDKINPGRLTSALAQILQHVPPEDCLLALHNVPLDFDPQGINSVLADLTPSNVRIMWASRDFQGKVERKEEWYGTEYSFEGIPEAWLEQWSAPGNASEGLHLPETNPFIPTDFSLLQDAPSGEDSQPRVVHETGLLQLWYKAEVSFEAPQAVIYLALQCPEAYCTPENAVLARLFVKLLIDQLNGLSYEAELAGLTYRAMTTTSGFLISFSGYNHKLMELVRIVLNRVVDFEVQEDRFLVQKEALTREYANIRYEQPYQTAIYHASVLHEVKRWHYSDYEAVIGDLAAADLEALLNRLFQRVWVQGFATGNLKKDEAVQLASYVEKLLQEKAASKPLFQSQRAEARVVKLQTGRPSLFKMPVPNSSNKNSAILMSYQVGLDSPRENVLGELWVKCTKQEAFRQLRSQQQLGYIVMLSTWSFLTVRSLAFLLQSTTYPAGLLEDRCENFLLQAAELLERMSDAEFEDHVEELVKAKLEKPKRLREQAAKQWREIDDGTLEFLRPKVEVAALKLLKREDLLQFFKEKVHDCESRKKLSVHVEGAEADTGKGVGEQSQQSNVPENGYNGQSQSSPKEILQANGVAPSLSPKVELINDIWAFRRRQEIYASLQ